MSTPLIIAAAVAVGVPLLLAILFKTLWKVPSADEALIVTGFAASRNGTDGKTFKIITGGGAFVIPVLQKAQYLGLAADKALLEVEGVDSQKIPVRAMPRSTRCRSAAWWSRSRRAAPRRTPIARRPSASRRQRRSRLPRGATRRSTRRLPG